MPALKKLLLNVVNVLPLWLRVRFHKLPLLGRAQRKLFAMLTRGSAIEEYTVTAGPGRGIRFALKLPEEKPFWKGTHELVVVSFLEQRCRKGDVCWDVGSHIGYIAAILGRKSGEKVYCFEPLPENAERIRRQQVLNPAIRLELIGAALGARSGLQEFEVLDDRSMGKLVSSTFQQDVKAPLRRTVRVLTMDEAVGEGTAPVPNLIKVDTEGAEYQVLAGGEDTLKRHHPRLLLEVHGCADDERLFSLLNKLSYKCRIVETGVETRGPVPSGMHLWCE